EQDDLQNEKPAEVSGSDAAEPADDDLPVQIPLLPLRSEVAFPEILLPLVVNRPKSVALIDDVMKGDKLIGLVTQKNPDVDDPDDTDLYPVLCVSILMKMLRFPDGSTRIVTQGLYRAKLTEIVATEP